MAKFINLYPDSPEKRFLLDLEKIVYVAEGKRKVWTIEPIVASNQNNNIYDIKDDHTWDLIMEYVESNMFLGKKGSL